jgi:hypothetical protein
MSSESKEKPILFEFSGLCFVLFAIDMLQQNLTAKSQIARVERRRRRRHCQSAKENLSGVDDDECSSSFLTNTFIFANSLQSIYDSLLDRFHTTLS